MPIISYGYKKQGIEVLLSVQTFVPREQGQKERPSEHLQNKLNITASYIKSSPLVIFGKSFACLLGQENKLFPPKKKTNL
jgi:hypothetical protein